MTMTMMKYLSRNLSKNKLNNQLNKKLVGQTSRNQNHHILADINLNMNIERRMNMNIEQRMNMTIEQRMNNTRKVTSTQKTREDEDPTKRVI